MKLPHIFSPVSATWILFVVLVTISSGQIVDDPFASPFSIQAHCNASGAQLQLVVSEDSTPLTDFEPDRSDFADLSNTTIECASSRAAPYSLSDPVFPRVVPGETYFVHARLSQSAPESDIELLFDVPQGYRLIVGGVVTTHVAEKISLNQRWTIVLERADKNEGAMPGSYRGPYFGDNFLFDISLGTMPSGFDAGILRVDKAAFEAGSGSWNRSLIVARQRFDEMTFIYDSGANDEPLRQVHLPGILVDLNDVSSGCSITFYEDSGTTDPIAIDHDSNPSTIEVFDVNDTRFTLLRTWTITAESYWNGPVQCQRLNLSSDYEGVQWDGQVNLEPIGYDQWYFRSGKMSDGNWLREIKYYDTPMGPPTWRTKRTVSVSGVEDTNLDNTVDTGEALNFQSVKELQFETITPFDGSGSVLRLVESIVAPGTADERSTTYTYVDGSADIGSLGKISTITLPSGTVEERKYYGVDTDAARRARGRLKEIDRSYPITFDAECAGAVDSNAKEVTKLTWQNEASGAFFDFQSKDREGFFRRSDAVEIQVSDFDHTITTIYGGDPDSSDDDVRQSVSKERIDGSTPATYKEIVVQTRSVDAAVAAGRPHAMRNSDSELGSYFTYEYGSYNPTTRAFTVDANGLELRTTEITGVIDEATGTEFQTPAMRVGHSRKIETIESEAGPVLDQKVWQWVVDEDVGGSGDYALIEERSFTYDTYDRLETEILYETGGDHLPAQTHTLSWTGGRLVGETLPDGRELSYQYDALGRRVKTTEAAMASTNFGVGQTDVSQGEMYTETVYDPRGNAREVRKSGAGVSDELTEERIYNLADEVTDVTLACSTEQQISRTLSTGTNEGWVVIETAGDGTDTITTYYDDGRVKEIQPSGGPASYYRYGVGSDGTRTTLVRFGTDASSAPYEHSERNWVNDVVLTKLPTLDDTVTEGTLTYRSAAYAYDVRGRVLSVAQTDLPTTHYDYGDPGVDDFTRREWVDLDGDGVFDDTVEPAAELWTRAHLIEGEVWQSSTRFVYAKNGSAVRTEAGEERVRVSGLSPTAMGESQIIDNEGHARSTTVTRSGLQYIETVTVPTGSESTLVNRRLYAHGRLYREEDALGRYASYEFDSLGRLEKSTDFEGHESSTVFKTDCSKIDYEQSGVDGLQIGYRYYSSGTGSKGRPEYRWVITENHTAYGASSDTITYPENLDPSSADVVSLERFTYDSSGRLDKVYSAGDLKTETTYDSLGRKNTVNIYQNGSVYSQIDWDYDSSTGQLLQRADTPPNGGAGSVTEKIRYYRSGAPFKKIDARNVTTTFTYGGSGDSYAYGHLKQTSYGDVDYGANGTISTPSVVQTYNRLGAMATLNNGVTGLQSFAYDDAGASASLRLQSIAFDNSFYLGAVDELSPSYESADGTTALRGRTNGFAYRADGITVAAATYGYDAKGRRSNVTASGFWGIDALEGTRFDLTYESDLDGGRLTEVAAPLLAHSGSHFAQTYGWNTEGRLETIASGHDGNNDGILDPSNSADFVNARYRYTYNGSGQREWERADGHLFARYTGAGLSTKYNYDESNQLEGATSYLGLAMSESATKVLGRDFGFTYDDAGNRTSRSVDGSSTPYSLNPAHTYLSRTNSNYTFYAGMGDGAVTVGGTTVVSGNRQGDFYRHGRDAGNDSGAVWNEAEVAGGSPSQSTTVGTVVPPMSQSFSYDASGNLLADGEWNYQYDALNRLRVMERVDTIGGLPTEKDVRLEFLYDEQNRRVEKTVKERSSGALRYRQRFLYEGWNLVATLDVRNTSPETASLASRYVWRTTSADTGSFGLLMVAGDHDGSSATPQRAYYTGYDGKGNLTSLADNLQGVAAAAFEYSPFGEILRKEGSSELPDLDALGAHFGFATQYADAESGLIYFGHRYYSPSLGRFISKDPLGEAGSLNQYAYASNNPINLTDFRGLCDGGYDSSGGWGFMGKIFGGVLDAIANIMHVGAAALNVIGDVFDAIGLDPIGDLFHGIADVSDDIGDALGAASDYFDGNKGFFDTAFGGALDPNGKHSIWADSGGDGANTPDNPEEPQQTERWSKEDCDKLASQISNLRSSNDEAAALYGERSAVFADFGGDNAISYLADSNLLLGSGILGIESAEFVRLAGNAAGTERLGTAGTIWSYGGRVRAPFVSPQVLNGIKIAGRVSAVAGIAFDAYNLANAENAYDATVSASNIGIAGAALGSGNPYVGWTAGWYFVGQGIGNAVFGSRDFNREYNRLQGLVDEARDLSVYGGKQLNKAESDYETHCK